MQGENPCLIYTTSKFFNNMKMTMIICGAIPKELLIVINEEKTIKNTPPKATKSPRKEVTKKKVNTPVKAKKTTKKVKKILTKKSK